MGSILNISIITVLASAIGTVSGFGISTLMVPIILFFLPYSETLLFVGLVHWFGDVWKLFIFKRGFNWKLLLSFGVPGIIMSYLGARLTFDISTSILERAVGLILIVYVFFLLSKPTFKLRPNMLTSGLGGSLSGLLGGLTGVAGGAVRAVVLTSFNLEKEIYVFTTGLIGATIDASRILGYFSGGTNIPKYLLMGLPIFIFASYVGVRIGKVLVDKIPQQKFRIVVAIFLFLIGVKLAISP